MNKEEFDLYQEEKRKQYEDLCKRCGACCGALDEDSCKHLIPDGGNKYICEIYDNRYGLRQTKTGRYFLCVPIRKILFKSWTGSENCVYKKAIKH